MQDNLRKWKTGGLGRLSPDQPFEDIIRSAPTRREERALAPHPSLKPQAFMRQIVRASLPLGTGTVLDPFMGGGSTVAAALAVDYESIGIESDPAFFKIAERAIPRLAELAAGAKSETQERHCAPMTEIDCNHSLSYHEGLKVGCAEGAFEWEQPT